MKDLFYTELRERIKEIEVLKQEHSETERNKDNHDILSAISFMINLSKIGRQEGLLALEEAINEFDQVPYGKYLSTMILLIADGTEPEIVEDVGLTRFFSGNLKAYEGLIYLMFLKGALSVQVGENPRILKQKLKAMLPEDVAELYETSSEENL